MNPLKISAKRFPGATSSLKGKLCFFQYID
jgi:hypothetical protein